MRSIRRILYVLPQPVYPADTGPKHHTFGLAKHMSTRAECHFVGFAHGPTDREQWGELERVLPNSSVEMVVDARAGAGRIASRLGRFVTGRPVSPATFESGELRRWLRHAAATGGYDLVHFDTFNLTSYRKECASLPTVLAPTDAFSMGMRRAYDAVSSPAGRLSHAWKAWAYFRHERSVYHRFTKVCPVSAVDLAYLQRIDPRIDGEVVEIPLGDEFLGELPAPPADVEPHVLCSGFLFNEAIASGVLEFLREVHPRLRAENPSIRVSVWGSDPHRSLADTLKRERTVRHAGWVEDYREFLASASVYVYPQRSGSGIQTKVQQAMALGVPVVARAHVLEAIGAEHRIHAIAAEGNEEMANAILTLLRDPAERTRIGLAGAKFVRSRFDPEVVGRRLEGVYQRAADKHWSAVGSVKVAERTIHRETEPEWSGARR